MNSSSVQEKLSAKEGRVAALADSPMSPRGLIEEIYLLAYCRLPTDQELAVADELFRGPVVDRRAAVEDLLWALLNSAEFVFKD